MNLRPSADSLLHRVDLCLEFPGGGFHSFDVSGFGGDRAFPGLADVIEPNVGPVAAMLADEIEQGIGTGCFLQSILPKNR